MSEKSSRFAASESQNNALQAVRTPAEKVQQLEQELTEAREQLVAAEAALAEEQAAVNAFRMHCRLTIGNWVDTLMDLRREKQSCLIQLQLLKQELGIEEDEDDAPEPLPDDAHVRIDENDGLLDLDLLVEETAVTARDRQAEKRLYRELARRFHPDLATNSMEQAYRTTIMAAVNAAYRQRDVQTMRDLAGELDPKLVAAVDNSETTQIRRLRKQLLGCMKRQRKVAQQLKALRRENTARLWHHAQTLAVDKAENWWSGVQQQLMRETEKLRIDIKTINTQLTNLQAQQEDEADEN
ncbi:MAG: J domain-containing protein [Anaerolineales bacterium]|nr:J domain-containing protein [Anaerolineales bacterium]